MSRRNRSAAEFVVGRPGRSVAFALVTLASTATLACTTTLDPSVLLGEEDAGSGDGGEPLAACTLVAAGGSEYLFCPGRLTDSAAAADCALRGATLCAM